MADNFITNLDDLVKADKTIEEQNKVVKDTRVVSLPRSQIVQVALSETIPVIKATIPSRTPSGPEPDQDFTVRSPLETEILPDFEDDLVYDVPLNQEFTTGVIPDMTLPPNKAINLVKDSLKGYEGSGDNVTNIPTADSGLTLARWADIEAQMGVKYTEKEAIDAVLLQDYNGLMKLPGYSKISSEAQAAILDTAYNFGPGLYTGKAKKMATALAKGDMREALIQTLDTSNSGGRSMKGIAIRRAKNFNRAFSNMDDKIYWVNALPDGTIQYLSREYRPGIARSGKIPKSVQAKSIIFEYRKPRHPKSRPQLKKIM